MSYLVVYRCHGKAESSVFYANGNTPIEAQADFYERVAPETVLAIDHIIRLPDVSRPRVVVEATPGEEVKIRSDRDAEVMVLDGTRSRVEGMLHDPGPGGRATAGSGRCALSPCAPGYQRVPDIGFARVSKVQVVGGDAQWVAEMFAFVRAKKNVDLYRQTLQGRGQDLAARGGQLERVNERRFA